MRRGARPMTLAYKGVKSRPTATPFWSAPVGMDRLRAQD